MRSLPLPNASVRPVIEACTKILTDPDLVLRLWNAVHLIESAEANYLHRGPIAELFLTVAATDVGGLVNQAEMKKLYNGTFVRKGSYLRSTYYDTLLVAAPFGMCPSCYQRPVSTLDHYLPKDDHPALAVTPANLVPNCGDCNKIKGTIQAAVAELQLLHPYFDDVEDGVWLKADVVPGNPPSLKFTVESPEHWDEIKFARVKEHFRVLELNKLYTSQASRLIADIGHRMNKLLDSGGAAAVAEHLAEEAETRQNPTGMPRVKNSWQIAAYTAMSQSAYFCAYRHARGY